MNSTIYFDQSPSHLEMRQLFFYNIQNQTLSIMEELYPVLPS